MRSGTSVGANLNEAIYGNSKADFISKLHISLKEVSESIYWLTLLEIPASITACEFYKKMGYTHKNGIDKIDNEQLYRLEKYR